MTFQVAGLKPEHKVCEHNVEVPTILIESFLPGDKPEVFVQWFGDSDNVDLGDMQFRFPLPMAPDDVKWMGQPDSFNIIMVGQVKDWPNPEAIRSIARIASNGNSDAWIYWLTSEHDHVYNDAGTGPPCFVVPLGAMLGDPMCGVIRPRKYLDITVLERANEAFERRED